MGIECDLGWKLKVPTRSLSVVFAAKKFPRTNIDYAGLYLESWDNKLTEKADRIFYELR